MLLATVARAGEGDMLTTAPPKPVRIPAEFEPMQTVVVDWQMIDNPDFYKRIAEDVNMVLLYNSDDEYQEMQTKLPTYGLDMNRCEFNRTVYDPIPRDDLPWLLFIDRNKPAFMGNGVIAGSAAEWFPRQGYPMYYSGVPTPGGDFMTDGQGAAVSLQFIADHYRFLYGDAGYTLAERVLDYWGIHTYHIISNPVTREFSIPPHIDCLAKFLSPDTILVVRYSSSNPLYERTEAAAAYFRRQISCYGTPYKLLRLDIPKDEPYINSLILNRKVLVPTMARASDADALAVYRAAMPGYEVIGFDNPVSTVKSKPSKWGSSWALHCDTLGIADAKMLYIKHVPLLDRPPESQGFPIRAEIEAFSGTEFVEGTPVVVWRAVHDVNDPEAAASWNTVAMAPDPGAGERQYLAYIPVQPVGMKVQYYLRAKDASGRDETHPYIGKAQAHTFSVATLGSSVSAVSAARGGSIEFYANLGPDKGLQTYHLCCSILDGLDGPNTLDVALPETMVFSGFDGVLDDCGMGVARLTLPPSLASEWVGRVLRFSLELGEPRIAMPDAVSVQILE
jgi:agmatine/peptidylarginine deiminase